jgi:YtkA-like
MSPGETYTVGMAKSSTSGALTVELADALPAPPGYGPNRWVLRIKDASQNPILGADINIGLKMPEHADHMIPGTTGTELAGGTYEVTDLNLIMAGLYNITVEVTQDGRSESVRFQFCVRRQGD